MKSAIQLLLEPSEKFERACVVENYQGKGPGGQKRNRVKSGVRLSLLSGNLSVTADGHRETVRNKKEALEKLRVQLVLKYFNKENLSEPLDWQNNSDNVLYPTVRKRFRDKINVAHPDFCLCVFIALVVFKENTGELKPSALELELSSTRFVKFLAKDKHIWETAQRIRQINGKTLLKI